MVNDDPSQTNSVADRKTDDTVDTKFCLNTDERIACLKTISARLMGILGILFVTISIIVGSAVFTDLAKPVSKAQSASSAPAGQQTDSSATNTTNPTNGTVSQGSSLAGLTPLMVFMIGMVGAFVSLQRRISTFSDFDLKLIANSWFYTSLPPFVGGLLAVVLMYVFIGKMLSGALFPEFTGTDQFPSHFAGDFLSVFFVGANPASYAKLIFWAFAAGFSERFVIDLLGQFEKKTQPS